jgi:hypothetical protein
MLDLKKSGKVNILVFSPFINSNTMEKIWVNEQLDPTGIIYACIACLDETAAQDCHKSWQENLSTDQKNQGWTAQLRTVKSWDEVPVNALKLSF